MVKSKRTKENVESANEMRGLGWTYRDIAEELGISHVTAIDFVKNRESILKKLEERERLKEEVIKELKKKKRANVLRNELGINYDMIRTLVFEKEGKTLEEFQKELGVGVFRKYSKRNGEK